MGAPCHVRSQFSQLGQCGFAQDKISSVWSRAVTAVRQSPYLTLTEAISLLACSTKLGAGDLKHALSSGRYPRFHQKLLNTTYILCDAGFAGEIDCFGEKIARGLDPVIYEQLTKSDFLKPVGRQLILVDHNELAQAVVEEWSTQGEFVNPATMPLTRFSNTAIDQVSAALAEVASDITAYAGSDLVCYRAHEPDDLVALQSARWDPVIEWAREALRAHFTVVKGVVPVEQPRTAIFAVGAALEPHEPFRLTGLHVLTTLTGSAMLALAHARGFLSAQDAWSAAHVDEDFQIKLWGIDDEAAARRTHRLSEFEAASRLLSLL